MDPLVAMTIDFHGNRMFLYPFVSPAGISLSSVIRRRVRSITVDRSSIKLTDAFFIFIDYPLTTLEIFSILCYNPNIRTL
jgi:hypothetical protein